MRIFAIDMDDNPGEAEQFFSYRSEAHVTAMEAANVTGRAIRIWQITSDQAYLTNDDMVQLFKGNHGKFTFTKLDRIKPE